MLNRRFMLGLLGAAPAAAAVGIQEAPAKALPLPPSLPNIPLKDGKIDYITMMEHAKAAPFRLNAFRARRDDSELIQQYINSNDETYIDDLVQKTPDDCRSGNM
jgi:hypothetical protein